MEVNLDNLSPDMIRTIWIMLAARVVIWLFYANAVRKLMLVISAENRFMNPAQAWWLAIPFVNIYWNFLVARNLSNSLNNEFFDRKIAEEENPGLGKGLMFAWMFLLSHIPFPTFILLTFFILGTVYFIQYWVKVANFRNLLLEHNRTYTRKTQEEEVQDIEGGTDGEDKLT